METGKPGLVSAPVHISSVAAQTEKRMDIQAPLTAVYIHTVPALPAQPYPQPAAAVREPATLHLAMPPLYSKETLPFLTLHIAGGLQAQPGLSVAAAAPAARPKSSGKHVCPHCGRDCMKPSVLEKHLRCHTGERPYPCTTCGVSFKTQSNLYKHKRTQAHARLSSESEQSSLGSLDSMSSSRETCTSSLSMDEQTDESGSMEKDAMLPATTSPAHTTKVYSKTQGSVSEQNELTLAGHKTVPNESEKVTVEEERQRVENEKPSLTVSRHLPLQRQEATLFSKQWESSVSSGKSQSHESTDSGFSESSDHYPSPASILPDHSMDSLTESTKEHVEEMTSTNTPSAPGQGRQEPKDTAKEQEQKTLEERISKLISENTAVVEDKQLDNVRPRKTVLSKQGSIDLPMPYTYKDSFHFDMKIGKTQNVGLQRNRAPGLYSSVPTQRSTTVEHAPLTRSNSLPFSVTLLQPERSSPTSSYQSDYVTLVRRGSSGQINPTSFTIKPVNQHSSTHRPLVRQTAVDCNHATDGLFMNSSVEEACTGSLSCDGDGGDICAEPSNRKFRRKKAQKFAYNKWYMYGGGTFKKLYNAEKGGDNTVIKGRKCVNPEHEVVQSTQKRLSAVSKETVTTTGSTIKITSSSATVCHSGSTPAKPPYVPALNFDLKTSQHHSLNSSLKVPLQRNLSLSVLPLASAGSLAGLKTSSMSSAEALVNEVKHSDSTLQLCGAHVPSDRKKQKTDDKIIFPLTMKTDPNTVTHLLPSVTGSVPQQETNLSYINFPKNQKHTQLNGALFLPSIINTNAPHHTSVNTSPATSVSSPAKTSFLPKYQLKLPNAAETDSNSSLHVVDKPSGTEGRTFTSALLSSHTEQNSPLDTISESRCNDPITSPLMQTCDVKKMNTFNSTEVQLLLPHAAAAKTSLFNTNATSSLPVVHRQSAAPTITTTCLKNYQAGLCSTSIQPSKSVTGSEPMQLPRAVAPTVANFSDRPSITTANDQRSSADITVFSQGHPTCNPPLSNSQPSPASNQLNPVNRTHVGPNRPMVPCHIVPFNQEQQVAQKVFHVHTADLQICLQIISDEQLALIEPQIERQAGSSHSQTHDAGAFQPEVIRNKAQNSVTMEIANEGRDHQQPGHQKDMNPSGTLPTLNVESIKPSLSVHFGKVESNIHMSEHCNSSQATISAESKPPETLGLTLRPHKNSNVSTATETLSSVGDVMSTAASLIVGKSGKHQTSDEEHDRNMSLNYSGEEQVLRVSQGQLVSQTLSGQQNFSGTCLSSSIVNQNSSRRELLGEESQEKLQGAKKTKGEASACKSSTLESGEAHPLCQVQLSQASGIKCAKELCGSGSAFSINTCKASRQNSQASIYCSNPSAVNTSKHANRGCDRVEPSDNSSPLQETTLRESQDAISSAHSKELLGPFTSVSSNIQVETPKDIPASIQSPAAGVREAVSLLACAGQKEPQAWGHGETPVQPDSTNCRLKLSQDTGETNHQCAERQGGGGATGEDKDRGIHTDQGEDLKVDSFKNSWLSEEHLSQAQSGMSQYHPQSPQQALSTSNNLNLPSSGNQSRLFHYPQPPLEMNSFYFSQQQQWENSVIQNHQTQSSCESNLSEHIKAQAQLTEPQSPQPTGILSHQDQKQEQEQSLCILHGNTTKGDNRPGSCCTEIALGSHKRPTPDDKTPSTIQHCKVSHSPEATRGTAVWTGNTQVPNNSMVDNNIVMPSKLFIYPDSDQDTKDWPPNDYTTQSSNSGRSDMNSKYQSFFLTGQFHSFQPGECLTSGVRPVQSCQDYSEDTSSSDDEGKLIIEL